VNTGFWLLVRTQPNLRHQKYGPIGDFQCAVTIDTAGKNVVAIPKFGLLDPVANRIMGTWTTSANSILTSIERFCMQSFKSGQREACLRNLK
jgi:hypothetical protein